MKRNESGVAVPSEKTALPLVVRDVMHESDQFSHGKAIFDANGEEFIGLYAFQSEDDMVFVQHAANYHERFADIVRRLLEWHFGSINNRESMVKICYDANTLWAEYQEEPK